MDVAAECSAAAECSYHHANAFAMSVWHWVFLAMAEVTEPSTAPSTPGFAFSSSTDPRTMMSASQSSAKFIRVSRTEDFFGRLTN